MRVDEDFWSFDDGGREAGNDVELDVTMEEPDAYTWSAFSRKDHGTKVTYLDYPL